MRELSLFTGAGGGLLGTHCLLGWRSAGYVEINDYCQRVIQQRIGDGLLDDAPIFGDIRAFIDQGYAERYRGMVDVVSAGFPCQPFSVAGRRRGERDKRNMWPQTIECVRVVRPQFVFLENVPGLQANQKTKVSIQWIVDTLFGRVRMRIEEVFGLPSYFGRILRDLAESGYDARWLCLSAAELGAPHFRRRLWIVAYTSEFRCQGIEGKPQGLGFVSNADSLCFKTGNDTARREEGANANWSSKRAGLGDSTSERLSQWKGESENQREEQPAFIRTNWWESEPGLGRVAHGVADRVDRLTAIGNGQVPIVAATAWLLLAEELI